MDTMKYIGEVYSAWLRPFNFHIQCDLHREGIKPEMVCILLIVIAFDGMLINTEESELPIPQRDKIGIIGGHYTRL